MSKRILYLGLDPTHFKTSGEMTHWPIIHILPRPLTDPSVYHALKDFDLYSHILITSKSAVAILHQYLPLMGIPWHTWVDKTTVAIGQVTAMHLKACGITSLQIAQQETAEGLIEVLKELPSLEKAYVFWPHSSQSRPVIKNFLEAYPIRHTTCILYDPKPLLPQVLPNLENFDEIVFTSPSTIDAFFSIFGEFPQHLCLTTIGPITADYLKNFRQKNQFLVPK